MTRICINSKCKMITHGFRLKGSHCPSCGKAGMMNVLKLLKIETRKPKHTPDTRQNYRDNRKPYRPKPYQAGTKTEHPSRTQ